jgi:hypothetical protein
MGSACNDLLRSRPTDAELGPEGLHVEQLGERFAHACPLGSHNVARPHFPTGSM